MWQEKHSLTMSRRRFMSLIGIGSTALLLSACGSRAPTSTPAAGNTSGQKVKLSFWLPGGSDTYFKAHQEIAKKYEGEHTNVDVEVTRYTGDQSFVEVLLARIAAGNPPSATVIWDTPVALGVRGSLLELDAMMATSQNCQTDNWPAAILASCQFGGKTYGLPVTAGTYGMWYNQELFEQKGVPSDPSKFPKTWDDMRQLSKEFTRWQGDKLETAGFVPIPDPYVLPIWSALNGSQIYDAKNQKYTIDSENNIQMMEYFLSWLDEEYKGDIQKVQNSGAWGGYPGSKGQPPAFQNSRLAMMLEGSWMMGDFYAFGQAKLKRWNVAYIPVGPSGSKQVSGYWPNWLAIPKGSNNPEEAFKYLDFMSVEGVQDWFAAVPDMPTNKKVPKNLVPKVVVEKRGDAFAKQVMDFFRKQQEIATPMWDSPIQSFAIDQLQRAIERIMRKAAKPKDALAEAQKACQAELEKTLKG
ncbi:extracellular solute-binding protein family 1 [Thermobaculum terrenum ATCC BAA-798]|uniref:Extracellular solute-binding protein family 1 n=1 Tax=Thermobaculum terrenum (strain ATCC BAA-798 / CCMEE 7001 / YNP1) TaxID=525904 RepID=D1CH17_THET1|nr:extracellular solute-binding protein [Thermobaculum terrenum]ACZ43038.1 extracellular solute-binding protein family 1 [Thermobaculum terrenum ATCC BAA-798]